MQQSHDAEQSEDEGGRLGVSVAAQVHSTQVTPSGQRANRRQVVHGEVSRKTGLGHVAETQRTKAAAEGCLEDVVEGLMNGVATAELGCAGSGIQFSNAANRKTRSLSETDVGFPIGLSCTKLVA